MMPSFRETVLLTTAGALAYAVCHFCSDREREKTRKNELAMELAGLRSVWNQMRAKSKINCTAGSAPGTQRGRRAGFWQRCARPEVARRQARGHPEGVYTAAAR